MSAAYDDLGTDLPISASCRPDRLTISRSLSGRRWVWRDAEERASAALTERLGVSELLGRLMALRDVALDQAPHYLDPTLRALLPDPSVLTDMDHAAQRLAQAVMTREMVAVFGDYDVDGACAGALMASLLRDLGVRVISYVPDRIREGYGPNARALQDLVARGASLIICVDCGTAAGVIFADAALAADILVFDHHKSDHLPAAAQAVVNPNRPDDTAGLQSLCAAGVCFMAAVALVRALRKASFFAAAPGKQGDHNPAEPDLIALLDLVAFATICDVMPLRGLNRAFVAQGLKVMARRCRPGLAALLDVAGVTEAPTAMSCGFALGPRINAAGRINDCSIGIRLLSTNDPTEARELALLLDDVNRERQTVEGRILDAALAQGASQTAEGASVLLVHGEAWHPGVVGIVASRLKEKYNRPVCVGGLADGVIRGSGRSVQGFDLGATIIAGLADGILLTGGGHAMAAGFSLSIENLDAFRAHLTLRLAGAALLPGIADLAVESLLTIPAATMPLALELVRLAPFGPGNEEPVFVLPYSRILRADRIGKKATTIRAIVEGEGGGPRLKALLFRPTDALAEAFLHPASQLHLAGHLRAEPWNGSTSLSFVVVDAAPA